MSDRNMVDKSAGSINSLFDLTGMGCEIWSLIVAQSVKSVMSSKSIKGWKSRKSKDASVNVFLFFSGGRASEGEGLSLCGAAWALSPSTLIGWLFND